MHDFAITLHNFRRKYNVARNPVPVHAHDDEANPVPMPKFNINYATPDHIKRFTHELMQILLWFTFVYGSKYIHGGRANGFAARHTMRDIREPVKNMFAMLETSDGDNFCSCTYTSNFVRVYLEVKHALTTLVIPDDYLDDFVTVVKSVMGCLSVFIRLFIETNKKRKNNKFVMFPLETLIRLHIHKLEN